MSRVSSINKIWRRLLRSFPALYLQDMLRGPVAAAAVTPGGFNVEPSMRPWRYLGPNPDGWWCMPPNCILGQDPLQRIESELRLLKELGAAVVRVEFPWFLLQPERDRFDWVRSDVIVSAAERHGIPLQPILVYSPRWAAPLPNEPASPHDFGQFTTSIVERYKGTIRFWELWNEPDLAKYWSAGVERYVSDVLIPGYRAIERADPAARVILGGPSWPNLRWLESVYANGGADSFDIMAFHHYGDDVEILKHGNMIRSFLRERGRDTMPIWLGEYGVQENRKSDRRQQLLMRRVLTSSKSPLDMAIWYNLRDDDAMCCCPPVAVFRSYWGLVCHDGSIKKNGFFTMQRLLRPPG